VVRLWGGVWLALEGFTEHADMNNTSATAMTRNPGFICEDLKRSIQDPPSFES
jgi:hypothetical protein